MDGDQRPTTEVDIRELDRIVPVNELIGQEYAGLPGSSKHARFLKSTTQSQLSRALYPGSSIVRHSSH